MNIMVKVVLIEKSGNLKETNVRNLLENELYKKCGYKTDANFKERAVWNVKVGFIMVRSRAHKEEEDEK